MPATRPHGSTRTILVVDAQATPDPTLIEALHTLGYTVEAASGDEAARLLALAHPDLIVLDLTLPDTEGLLLCSELRDTTDVPMVICSAHAQKRDAILGLKLGADDFINTPIDIYEMEARLEAVLRRTSRPTLTVPGIRPNELHLGALAIDRFRRSATLAGAELTLTPTEYRLLVALCERPNTVVSRRELASIVWGREDVSKGRTIDMHLGRLRIKLGSTSEPRPPCIDTVRGFGYRIVAHERTVGYALRIPRASPRGHGLRAGQEHASTGR